ncbi:MAG: glycoside hydrolase family 99-like domain-containing protein [Bacteroidales bacterium]|nr:glycoside hydrolase family 99-like domain-containing protein [Bacteroidales bacterium]
MKTFKFCALLALIGAMATSCGNAPKQQVEVAPSSDYIVSAYIWPSCHDDPVAHQYLWEEGIGEWQVIKRGDPRFPGHYQPRQPLWGYELDNNPEVVEKWIQTALKYGVNTFCYDWYWFKEGPYLESALNDGFLKAPSNQKMNFYIMWANHDVKYNYWNYHKWGDREDLLFEGATDWKNFKIIVERVIRQYFKQPNYLKFNGCPIFAVFSMENFIKTFGSKEEAAKGVAYMREEVKKAGFPDMHFMMMNGGCPGYNEQSEAYYKGLIDALGIDSWALYNMGGTDPDYMTYGANSMKLRKSWDNAVEIPFFPCVSIGWDDTPRFPAKGENDVVHFHNTPSAFAGFLKAAKDYADAHADQQPKMININAWNEWVEGSYLLPDKLNGYGYLQAVRDVLDGKYD